MLTSQWLHSAQHLVNNVSLPADQYLDSNILSEKVASKIYRWFMVIKPTIIQKISKTVSNYFKKSFSLPLFPFFNVEHRCNRVYQKWRLFSNPKKHFPTLWVGKGGVLGIFWMTVGTRIPSSISAKRLASTALQTFKRSAARQTLAREYARIRLEHVGGNLGTRLKVWQKYSEQSRQ